MADIETPETQPGWLFSLTTLQTLSGHLPSLSPPTPSSLSLQVGIQVVSEDLCSEKQWSVCKALATFVAHRELSKVKLKQVIPLTEEEKTEHGVAAERRRMRLVYADTIKDLLAHCAIQDDPDKDCSNMVPAEKTRVESVELVLPPHANHQGNTFGGQIMAWMENVATIAASRLCHAHPTLKAIEMFHFRGPSQVGDRLVLKAIVNNAFKHRSLGSNSGHQSWPQMSFLLSHVTCPLVTFGCLCSVDFLGCQPEAHWAGSFISVLHN
ncbi:Acyl-coenzyme A thioesterase 11 [Lemmus lemmus]